MRIQYRFLFLLLKFCLKRLLHIINQTSLAHERKRFFAKVSANCLLRQSCFCWKIAGYTVLQSLQLCFPQQLLQRKMLFIKILACCCEIIKAEYYTPTVQQSLIIKKLYADLQLQADFAISHLYNTNADYSPHFRLLCGSVSWLISKFLINEINLLTIRNLWTQREIDTAKYNLTASSWQSPITIKLLRASALYSRKSDAYDNFTCNEYITLTNNNNMKLWSYSYKWLTLCKKIMFWLKASL